MKKEEKIVEEKAQKYPHKSLEKIEQDRAEFLNVYKKHNSLKIVISVVCIIAIIVAFVVIPNVLPTNEKLSTGLTIGIAILGLAGTLGYSVFTRKLMDKKMKIYFSDFYKHINDFAFEQEGFDKVELQTPGKITLGQFNECGLYKDVIETGSRGLTEFEYNSIPMVVVDCAGNIRDQKRMRPVFVGKYLYAAANYLDDEPIIVYLKGNERALPPTNLEGLTKVKEEVKYDIYSNSKKWDHVLTDDVLKRITAIKTNANLVDLAISIKSGKVHVMMGYDDPLMVLPLQQPFNSKPYEMFKSDLSLVVKVVEALNK